MNGDALPAVARLLDGVRGAERHARSHRMVMPRTRSATAGGPVPVGRMVARRVPRAERDGRVMVARPARRAPSTMAGAGPADGGALHTAAGRPAPVRRMVARCVPRAERDGWRMVARRMPSTMAR